MVGLAAIERTASAMTEKFLDTALYLRLSNYGGSREIFKLHCIWWGVGTTCGPTPAVPSTKTAKKCLIERSPGMPPVQKWKMRKMIKDKTG